MINFKLIISTIIGVFFLGGLIVYNSDVSTWATSDFRSFLNQSDNPDSIHLFTNNSKQIDLLTSGNEISKDYIRWSYDNYYSTQRWGSNVKTKSYVNVYESTTLRSYKNLADVNYIIEKDKAKIIQNWDLFRDSGKKNKYATVIREIEVYPNSNKETFKVIPYNNSRVCTKWIIESDEKNSSNFYKNGIYSVVQSDGIKIDWSQEKDKISGASRTSTGKYTISYKCSNEIIEIDPIIGIIETDYASKIIAKVDIQPTDVITHYTDGVVKLEHFEWTKYTNDGIYIEDAESLKNSNLKPYVENDTKYNITNIGDYNFTSFKNVEIEGSGNLPVRIWKESDIKDNLSTSKKVIGKQNKVYDIKKEEIINFGVHSKKTINITLGSGEWLTIGQGSTNVTLLDFGMPDLRISYGDVLVYNELNLNTQNSGGNMVDASASMQNITAISAGSTMLNVTWNIYSVNIIVAGSITFINFSSAISPPANVSFNSQTWTESSTIAEWANLRTYLKPLLKQYPCIATGDRLGIDLTSYTQTEVNLLGANPTRNMTIYFNATGTSTLCQYEDNEATTVGERPNLTMFYTLGVSNTAPQINATNIIYNGTLVNGTKLNGSASVFDNQTTDKINVTFQWYVNGTAQANLTKLVGNTGNGTTIYTGLNVTHAKKGETYILGANASDGSASSVQLNSSSIQILNTLPEFKNLISNTSTNEDIGFQIDLSTNITDRDLDGMGLSWKLNDTAMANMTINNATKVVYISPLVNKTGNVSINLTVRDYGFGSGAGQQVNFSISINAINDPPYFNPKWSNTQQNEDFLPYTLALNGTDVESDDLKYSWKNNDTARLLIEINNATDQITFTSLLTNQSGIVKINLTVWDAGGGENNTFNLTINPINDPPYWISDPSNQASDEDTAANYDVSSIVSDVDDVAGNLGLIWQNNDTAEGIITIVNATKIITLTPTANATGIITVNLTIRDASSSDSIKKSITWTINQLSDPPQMTLVKINTTNPANNNTLQNLTSYYTSTDLELDNKSMALSWYNNTKLFARSVHNETNLVAYYPLDNDVIDYAGSNDGSVSGAILNKTANYTIGSGAYVFDGVNDIITLPAIDATGTKTFSAWVNANKWTSSLIQLANGGSDYLVVNVYSNDILASANANNGASARTTDGSMTLNSWHHIAVTKTTSDITAIYIDGVDRTIASTTYITTSALNVIGRNYDGGAFDYYFGGAIDDVAIYSRALSAEEIKQIYLAGAKWNEINETWTKKADNWTLGVTPVDYGAWNYELNSSALEIGNSLPTWVNALSNTNTNEDTVFSVVLNNSNVTDLDDIDTLTLSWQSNNTANATITINNATNNLTFTPVNNASGIISVNLTVWDSGYNAGAGQKINWNITINAINDVPYFSPKWSNTAVNEDFTTYTLSLNETDVESDPITTRLQYNDTSLILITINNATDQITFTPVANKYGVISVNLTAFDTQEGETNTFNLTINSINDAPETPTNLLPANNSIILPTNFNLNWTNSANNDTNESITYNLNILNLSGGVTNKSSGFSYNSLAIINFIDIAYYNSSFYLLDNPNTPTVDRIIHVDSSGNNLTDGFRLIDGNYNLLAINNNSGIIFIEDSTDDFIAKYNLTDGTNLTGGFFKGSIGTIDTRAIVYDFRNDTLWLFDFGDRFAYHINATDGTNLTNGFSLTSISAAGISQWGAGIDPRNNTFWIATFTNSPFVYHADKLGNNLSDGFSTLSFGLSTSQRGLTFDPRDNSLKIGDTADKFIYDIGLAGSSIYSTTKIESQDLGGRTNHNVLNLTLIRGNSYQWDVSASDGLLNSLSVLANFTVNSLPTLPLGLNPTNSTRLADLTPNLTWNKSIDLDNSQTLSYCLDISESSSFSSIVYNTCGITGTGSNVEHNVTTNLNYTIYYWRLNVTDGLEGASSYVYSNFTLNQIASIQNINWHPYLTYKNESIGWNATIIHQEPTNWVNLSWRIYNWTTIIASGNVLNISNGTVIYWL